MPQPNKNKKILFLDRDGVINVEPEGYITDWSDFEFLPGALDTIKRATDEGYRIIIISNQSAIGRGMCSKEKIDEIMSNMVETVEAHGGKIEDIFYCPHTPEDMCKCRKPKPDLFFQAAEKYNIKLTNTWFVGDKLTDVAVAMRVGTKPILISGGKPVPDISVTEDDAAAVVNNLSEAFEYLLSMDRLRAVTDA
ncbi:D-glycero-beta-D-manno-heptose 1,7-bisphosphate 7-phosphatase [Candidatus Marinimicrobia bacterium MT.SAG.3]|nr:D-glycero-beta-D-manno-heptose 1,7-bisphosphate 7-phosphatase [Candidatus Marinimicrobia bacterium MT.SAG.3]